MLVEAGPEQAATWRRSGPWSFWKGAFAQPDVSGRPLGLNAVGRRLDLHRRTGQRQVPSAPGATGDQLACPAAGMRAGLSRYCRGRPARVIAAAPARAQPGGEPGWSVECA